LDVLKDVLNVNVLGTFLCTKYQMRQMMQQDSIEVLITFRDP
jgi:NAD(P)-dependent dehydrogenase (short-subunit alcohol dehydrogenase family)